MAFVMVLSFSRQIFLRFYLNQRMDNFLRGHVAAFSAWGGVPTVLLYDNLKSAVLERHGDAIRFHPTLLALSAHYRFEPRPVAVARGNEKGRVERAIRYIRDSFFAGRRWSDIDDLNAQADDWCTNHSARRACPEDRSITVSAAFASERPQLLTLPEQPFPCHECVEVRVGKTAYVRFDLNDYSLPHTHVQRSVMVHASLTAVRILEGEKVLAEHVRTWGKAEQIENPAHIEALVTAKRQARQHRGQDRLAHAAPASAELLTRAAARGNPLRSVVSQLLQLLDDYGAAELEQAIGEALQQDVPHPNAVRQALERRRELRHLPPPLALALPTNAHHIVVRPASLAHYDNIDSNIDTRTPRQRSIDTTTDNHNDDIEPKEPAHDDSNAPT